ncbi:MAG: carbamoyltransferase [Candidatus Omnitrophica bacterium]|nr:carbamoyltransferase [Candidatus Omnitrophota bacterium]
MNILGISAFYHDSAAALIRNGEIVAAAQEERFSRRKHDYSFPAKAISYCLESSGLVSSDLDYIVFYDKPFVKFSRILETYLSYAPWGLRSFLKAAPLWIKQKIWIKDIIVKELDFKGEVLFTEHHQSHAASAFYPSPFNRAAFLTVDGVGEWATASFGLGKENQISFEAEINFPHSLGLLYSAFTAYAGFKVNSGEYKVMGLAPYGQPKYRDLILSELIDLKDDGSFRLNMRYFNYCAGLTMTNKRFDKLFKSLPRKAESAITQHDMDLAASIQSVSEEVILRMANHVFKVTKEENLCLAGGVALNCVANGEILRKSPFKNLWIQPASGDAGGALGAALFVWYQYLNKKRTVTKGYDSQFGSYLGPEYSNQQIKLFIDSENVSAVFFPEEELIDKVTDFINDGAVIGWFQGRMEFGPRALGNRSIIGDARSKTMQETMNLKIKFRESFRPFAPSVLEDKAADYFKINSPSPYMLLVAELQDSAKIEEKDKDKNENLFGLEKLQNVRSIIPAVTHVDSSARLQTVNRKTNRLYYALIKKFEEKYNCPVIINTSFNVRGEPIVCTPGDAYLCFMRTNIDYLVLGNYLIEKKHQKPLDKDIDWLKKFELD